MDGITRDRQLNLRLRAHELEAIKRAARLERVRLSEFVRSVMVDAAQRRLAKATPARRGDNRRDV